MSRHADVASAVERGDQHALVDLVDSLCLDADWNLVLDLRDQCRAALERGKQLWPAAAYAEYRTALDGPATLAVSVLGSPAERFSPGPFAEVIASARPFGLLAPHLDESPAAFAVAHERVARGDDLRSTRYAGQEHDPIGLPLVLAPWEPEYAMPSYELRRVRDPAPTVSSPFVDAARVDPTGSVVTSERATERALRDLVGHWLSNSNGRCDVTTVDATASDAIRHLGCHRHRIAPISISDATTLMAWASSCGGAQGRRRGMSAGRYGAIAALTALCGYDVEDVGSFDDDFLAELGDAARDLRYFAWDDGSPSTGWSLHLAVEDVANGLAWAVSATDARLD